MEKYHTGSKIAKYGTVMLVALAFTHWADGRAAEDEGANYVHPKKVVSLEQEIANTPNKDKKPFIYKEGEGVDVGLIAVDGSCNLYTENTELLVALREYVAPEGIVYPDITYRIPELPCAEDK